MNHCQRHSYYVRKTIQWLEEYGYHAAKVEYNHEVKIQGRSFYAKKDLWASDIIFRNKTAMGFVQVKTNKAQLAEGVRKFKQDEDWPTSCFRMVVFWDKGNTIKKGPYIRRVDELDIDYLRLPYRGEL